MLSELGVTKDELKEVRNRMAQEGPTRSSSKELLYQYSNIIDGVVRKAFQKAQAEGPSSSVCLMAVGGYGRAELAPYSDVDLLLLHTAPDTIDPSSLIQNTLYPLWNLGLEVSCSLRSISECLKLAQTDLYVKTGLIDGRYLDGEFESFRTLHDLFSKKVLYRRVRQFAETLIQDIHLRHQKYEDPSYILEPNIKEGEGGLRDFQVGRWIIRAKYKTDRWESILFPDHSRTLDRSLQYLWAVRNQLHLFSERKQDSLTFELQEKIAPVLGFSPGIRGVEEMMKEYHLSTQKIANFVTSVLDRTRAEEGGPFFKKPSFISRRKKIDPYFELVRGELHLIDTAAFKRDLSQLMILFKHCQDYRARMDFRTDEAVLEALPFIDDRFRQSEIVNRTFLSILKKGEDVEILLKKMHELGFLSRYIPEFSEIEGKVHYDLYHVHPVDIHSILSVGELSRLKTGGYQTEYPLLTSLVREIEKPEILFLTSLLHDIGKGREGDHSLTGSEMADRIGIRMGLSEEERELLTFLVKHHLIMLEIALRRDLHDEQAILHFADQIRDRRRLQKLYLLTFADVKGVGPEAWTSWKNSLLMELFLKTSHLLEGEESAKELTTGEEMIKRLRERLSPETASQYVDDLPARYLSCYPFEEILRHIEMACSLEKESFHTAWIIEEGKRAKVTVCTKDRYGLFSKIAGSMFINRLSILEAQIHTWGHGIALDTFSVEDATGEVERRLQQWKEDIKDILDGTASLKTLISQKYETTGIRKIIPKVSPEVKINNQDSDFYTIIEIAGEDRLGILYDITQSLTDNGCHTYFARISTLGNRIVDVFYIQDELGEKIEDKQRLDHLKQTLLKRLASPEK